MGEPQLHQVRNHPPERQSPSPGSPNTSSTVREYEVSQDRQKYTLMYVEGELFYGYPLKRDSTDTHTPVDERVKQAWEFLGRVWGEYVSPHAAYFAIVTINGGVRFTHIRSSELQNLRHVIRKAIEKWDKERVHVYFQVLPLASKPEKGRGSAKDVKVGMWLWADLDFKESVENPAFEGCKEGEDYSLECFYSEGGKWVHVKRPSLSQVVQEVEEKLGKKPTIVVDSGAGYHLYFRLDYEVDDAWLRRIEEKLVDALGADEKSKDLARILRLPGTINPRVGRVTKVVFHERRISFNPEELEKRLAELVQGGGREPPSIVTIAKAPNPLDKLRELDDATVLKIVELLKEAYRPGYRQDLVLYLSGWLAKAGVSPLSATKIAKMLYDSCQDTDPLKTRLAAVVYSYKKAGIDLSAYAEQIEAVAGVKPYGLESEIHEDKVKGRSGLQEVLEEVLKDEARVLALMNELQEVLNTVSPFRDAVFELLDYERQLFAVADPRRGVIARARKAEGKMVYKERVAVVCPIRVAVYTSPLGGLTKYEITFEGPTLRKSLNVGPAYLEEIADRLKAEGLVYHSRLIGDVLAAVVQAFVKKGKAEIRAEVESPGFYVIDGKLESVKWEVREVQVEKLAEALKLLNELATWFSHAQDKFATVVKWGIAAPFTYIMKVKNNIMQRYLYLYGDSATGKTTLGRVVLRIWGLDSRYEKTGASIDTPARLGYVLSMSTFPVLVNEPGGALEREDVKEILKNAADGSTARGRYERGTYREFPALAPLIFTSNKYLPRDDALLRRMVILTFSYGDKIPPEKQEEFKRTCEHRLHLLAEIGHAAALLVREHPELVLEAKDAFTLGKTLLEKCFAIAGLPTPSWLELQYEETEDVGASLLDDFTERLIALINRLYAQLIGKTEAPPEDKLGALLRARAIPGMKLSKNNRVVIKRQLLDELGLNINMKSLAELLGGEYDRKYTEREDGAVKGGAAILCDYDKIVELLSD